MAKKKDQRDITTGLRRQPAHMKILLSDLAKMRTKNGLIIYVSFKATNSAKKVIHIKTNFFDRVMKEDFMI